MNFFSYHGKRHTRKRKAGRKYLNIKRLLKKVHLQRDKNHQEQISIEIFPFALFAVTYLEEYLP